ncbi:hypothetical protein Hdeb2414_s0013g00404051 [Helianthus debilis subsp. tardiflorus]
MFGVQNLVKENQKEKEKKPPPIQSQKSQTKPSFNPIARFDYQRWIQLKKFTPTTKLWSSTTGKLLLQPITTQFKKHGLSKMSEGGQQTPTTPQNNTGSDTTKNNAPSWFTNIRAIIGVLVVIAVIFLGAVAAYKFRIGDISMCNGSCNKF